MSRLRQRSRLRELARSRQQTSNNNNGEYILLDRNIVTPTNIVTEPVQKINPTPSTSVIEIHPTAPAHNSLKQGACGGNPTTQLPKRKTTDEQKYSSTITIPKQKYAVQSPQRQRTRGKLITISESDVWRTPSNIGLYNNAGRATGTQGSHQPQGQNADK